MFQKHTGYFVTSVTKGVFSLLHLKSIGVCFRQKLKNNPNCKQKHSFFTAEKHTVTWLTFSLSMVYQHWTTFCRCHNFSSFILFDNNLWPDSLHFSLLSVHPNGSSKAKNIKAASIRKDQITVKVKLNTLYRNVKTMYSQSNLFNKTNLIQSIISLSIYVPSNINIWITVWIPSEVPRFSRVR
jgi:hypothetical protein